MMDLFTSEVRQNCILIFDSDGLGLELLFEGRERDRKRKDDGGREIRLLGDCRLS